jgi:type IV pilus assembly protein PilM
MAKTRIGLDVGSTAVRAAELSLGSDPPTLVRAAQVPLPPGAVESGEVKDIDAVAAAMRELWQRGGFKSRDVVMGVGNQRLVVREVTIPALPEKELRESLRFQVADMIPIPIDDAVLDYDVLEEVEQDGQKMLRLLVVAAQREMLEQLVQAAVRAKLNPVGVDLIPFALVRSVGGDGMGLDEADSGGEAVVDVGADVTAICVHEHGITRFVRILPSGSHQITKAMATSLGMSEEEAEAIKRGQPADGGPRTADAKPVLDSRAQALVDEIRSSLDFYQAQSPGARVSRVLMTGGGSKLSGLTELLGRRVAAHVDRGRPFEKLNVRLALEEKDLSEAEPLLAVAVGLALPTE